MPIVDTPTSEPRFVGAVLATREINMHDDSDFVAVVWNEDMQRVQRVCYATTRCANWGSATIDATPEVQAAVRNWAVQRLRAMIRKEADQECCEISANRLVRSVSARSRKFPLDQTGYCNEPYSNRYGQLVVDIDPTDGGPRLYGIPLQQLALVNPSMYRLTDDALDEIVDAIVARNDAAGLASILTAEDGRTFLR
jgi:hypothetical protein